LVPKSSPGCAAPEVETPVYVQTIAPAHSLVQHCANFIPSTAVVDYDEPVAAEPVIAEPVVELVD
jgi:hypothetical protein